MDTPTPSNAQPASSSPAPVGQSRPYPRLTDAEADAVLRNAAKIAEANRAAADKEAPSPIVAAFHRAMKSVQAVDPEVHQRQLEAQQRAEKAEAAAGCHARAQVPLRYKSARLGDVSGIPLQVEANPGQFVNIAQPYGDMVSKLRRVLTHPGLYALCGEIGAGKTHGACALINEFCAAGRSARYVKAKDYIRDYRSTWRSTTPGAEKRFEDEHARFSLLVVDEWQMRRGTPDEDLILLELLDKRYLNGVATVLIGNHATQEQFEAEIDARIADRVADGGGFIPCNWPSLRGRIVAQAS